MGLKFESGLWVKIILSIGSEFLMEQRNMWLIQTTTKQKFLQVYLKNKNHIWLWRFLQPDQRQKAKPQKQRTCSCAKHHSERNWMILNRFFSLCVRDCEESNQSSSTLKQYNEKKTEQFNSRGLRIIFRINFHKPLIGLTIVGKYAWQQEEEQKSISTAMIFQEQWFISELSKDIQDAILLIFHFRIMLFFRAFSSSIFTILDVLFNLHSIINNGLIPGGQNSSKRQTVFFLSIDPRDKEHQGSWTYWLLCTMSCTILAQCMEEKSRRGILGRHRSCDSETINSLSDWIECNYLSGNTSSLLYSKSCETEDWRSLIWKSIRHDWTEELGSKVHRQPGEIARQPGGEVVRQAKFLQPPNQFQIQIVIDQGNLISRKTWSVFKLVHLKTTSLNVEQAHDRSGQLDEHNVAVQDDPEVYHEIKTLNTDNEAIREKIEEDMDFKNSRTTPHSTVKQLQSTSVRELIQKIENHPNRHALQRDLQQSQSLIPSVQNQIKRFMKLETSNSVNCWYGSQSAVQSMFIILGHWYIFLHVRALLAWRKRWKSEIHQVHDELPVNFWLLYKERATSRAPIR